MSFSYRWYGEKKTYHLSLKGSPSLDCDDADAWLTEELHELFDEADIVVAHNAFRFDNKVATAAFLRHNLTPPSPYKTVDTLRVAKGVARFNSNSLNALCEVFGIGSKSTITHSDIWYKCLQGDAKAWKLMEKYNNQDVNLLYALYEKLRPYISNHPNIGVLVGRPDCCPKCGSEELQSRGERHTNTSTYKRFHCQGCGGWCSSRVVDKTLDKPNYVNYS